MLTRLAIQDVVLIDTLALDFASGLSVFTGETGSGKSILLDALGLALGGRSDAGLVRAGAKQAIVTAEFALPDHHAALKLVEEHGLVTEDSLILRRIVSADGKSRAFVNEQPTSVGMLRKLGDLLLEIHGQFETMGLLDPATHRGLLDAFAQSGTLLSATSEAFHKWREAEESLHQALTTREALQNEEEYLATSLQELDDLAPQSGEAEKLQGQRQTLQHRARIADALQTASHCLDSDKGVIVQLTQAGKALARITELSPSVAEPLAIIDRLAEDASDVSHRLGRLLTALDSASVPLEKIEERLFALRSAARKYNTEIERLTEKRDDFAAKLKGLQRASDDIAAKQKQLAAAREAYVKTSAKLSAKRAEAAAALTTAMAKELPPLKLDRARFSVQTQPLLESEWSAEGIERVIFQASTNPGSPPGPLHKIASGGELARFTLALKVVLAKADPVPTLVFDEVDAGIGGATAAAVGERLARLGQNLQVLVVTHSPQVAALGRQHLRVRKQEKGKRPTTIVEPLTHDERREEIARMLAGTQVTDAARQAADSLMEGVEIVPTLPKRRA